MEELVLVALLGALTLLVASLRRRSARMRQPIAGLRPGWAEVRGRARAVDGAPPRLRAPISGREGIGWRVLVEKERGVRGWEPVVDLGECGDFELEDASGMIVVRPADTALHLDVGEQAGKGGPFAPPPAVVERLIAHHANPHGVLFHKGFRWREWVLEDQREVWVRGRVQREPSDVAEGYRRLGDRLILHGTEIAD